MHLASVLLAFAVPRSGKSPLLTPNTASRPTNLNGLVTSNHRFDRKDATSFRIVDSAYVVSRPRTHRTSLPSAIAIEADPAAARRRQESGRRILVTKSSLTRSLAFLSGVADVLCSHRHGCYANMMTGNTIKFASAVAEFRSIDAAFYAALLSSYVVGFGAYRAADVLVSRRSTAATMTIEEQEEEPQQLSPTPLVVAPAILAVFALYDVLSFGSGLSSPATRWFVPILAAGSAAVNAAGSETTGAVTNMMTGNLGKVANYATDTCMSIFLGGPRVRGERRQGARSSMGIVALFVSGIIAATIGIRVGGTFAPQSVSYGLGGGAMAAAAVNAVGRMPFTILGGIYALLLVGFNRPMPLKSPREVLRQLSWGVRQDVADPCQLDTLEAVCIIDPETEDAIAQDL